MHAFTPLAPDHLLQAGNTLTQRSLRTQTNDVLVKLDLAGMVDGQKAGLCHFSSPKYSTVGVSQTAEARKLEFFADGKTIAGPVLTNNALWLKSCWGADGNSHFAYSLDGKVFMDFGDACQMRWGAYRGDRIGLYCYNNRTNAGYMDVDWFSYRYSNSRWSLSSRSTNQVMLPSYSKSSLKSESGERNGTLAWGFGCVSLLTKIVHHAVGSFKLV